MKFTWFNLMAWPDLPSDFRQKHRSVWVDVPNSLYDPVKGHQVYNDHLDLLEYADQLGFDGIGINEHHSNAYGLMPSPNLMAAALTRRTSSALTEMRSIAIPLPSRKKLPDSDTKSFYVSEKSGRKNPRYQCRKSLGLNGPKSCGK
jgi:hypothetical protein